MKAAITSRSCNIKCWRERTDSFSPSHVCVSSGFRSTIETISPWEPKLAIFPIACNSSSCFESFSSLSNVVTEGVITTRSNYIKFRLCFHKQVKKLESYDGVWCVWTTCSCSVPLLFITFYVWCKLTATYDKIYVGKMSIENVREFVKCRELLEGKAKALPEKTTVRVKYQG